MEAMSPLMAEVATTPTYVAVGLGLVAVPLFGAYVVVFVAHLLDRKTATQPAATGTDHDSHVAWLAEGSGLRPLGCRRSRLATNRTRHPNRTSSP